MRTNRCIVATAIDYRTTITHTIATDSINVSTVQSVHINALHSIISIATNSYASMLAIANAQMMIMRW